MVDQYTSAAIRTSISKRLEEINVARRTLDEEELRLKTQWNSSVAINRLPNEIIFNILVLYEPNRNGQKQVPMGCIRIMSVCRYWYSIACGTPLLWSVIEASGDSVAWLDLCLTRSATTPLTVSLDTPSNALLQLVASQTRRIKSLNICAFEDPDPLSFLHGLMPVLERLRLNAKRGEVGKRFFHFEMTPRNYPLLHDLSVSCLWSMPRNAELYASLRELSLNDCADSNLAGLWDILSACTRLETLTLHNFLEGLRDFDDDEPAPPLCRPPISIPRLATLCIEDERCLDVADFLAQVVLSPATKVEIYAYLSRGEMTTPSMSAILPINRTITLPILSLATHVELQMYQDDYTMKASMESASACSNATSLELASDGIVDWQNYLGTSGLHDLVDIFCDAPLTHLDIAGDFDSVMAPDWKNAFLAFQRLEVLEFEAYVQSTPTAVWTALAYDAADNDITCPRLRSVTMHGCRMKGRGRADVFFEKTLACLLSRAAGGARRLQKLVLEVQSLGEERDEELKRKCHADLQVLVDDMEYELDSDSSWGD